MGRSTLLTFIIGISPFLCIENVKTQETVQTQSSPSFEHNVITPESVQERFIALDRLVRFFITNQHALTHEQKMKLCDMVQLLHNGITICDEVPHAESPRMSIPEKELRTSTSSPD